MATRRNRKSRKNYKKSRKNYKRVKRGGEESSLSQNMINMRDYDINLKKQQENQLQLGMNKERLSQLTRLKTFQSLDPDQQKAVATTFMSLTPDEQYKYIENFKYLGGSKTKKRRRNKKTIGGGECRDSVSKATTIDELNGYKRRYCGSLKIIRHKKCCKQIEEHLNTLQESKGIIEKDIENKYPLEETKEYSFDDKYTEFPPPRNY